MANKKRKILVTAALPYANGSLHLGHMVEYIQPDIWVRFQRLKGQECYFVCGDDAHGTPIMLRAESLNLAPEALIAKMHVEHNQDIKDFHVQFDNFYTTHSPENQALANEIYRRLKKKGDIASRTIRQAFDPVKNMFLPDRYVKGECPKCGSPDQYGDNCEVCGATYSPTDLKNPVSVVSGATPIEKETVHYFFCLDHYKDFLESWTKTPGRLQPEVAKKLNEWFDAGLQQWDITRDPPYFGFEIEDTPGKYFYVWLDAPIGYMASFQNFCEREAAKGGPRFEDFWQAENTTELYHFIGKDIVYFHALFWPAILHGSGYRTPTVINVHGFLTVNGQKMSKSRGTFILARQYLEHCPPEYLRYYFASKLGSGVEDIDFQLEDFVHRINSDLVGKLVNIASRSAGFISTKFGDVLSDRVADQPLHDHFVKMGDTIAEHFEQREYRQAIREIMKLADEANRYIDDKKPWVLAKSEDAQALAQDVCSLGLNLFRILMIYLKPVLPELAEKTETFLKCNLNWDALNAPLLAHRIEKFQPLAQRLDMKEVSKMIEIQKDTSKDANSDQNKAKLQTDTQKAQADQNPNSNPTLSIEEFNKADLRVAKILQAESVPEADKLIRLNLNLGGEDTRQVFAGLKEAYPDPSVLIGKLVVMVANLAPRKMRFGVSEGMVLTSSDGGSKVWILEPHPDAIPGTRVK